MKVMLVIGACFPQENVAPTPSIDPDALEQALGDAATEDERPVAEAPEPEVWDGTFAEGMSEVVRLAASDDVPSALAISDRLLVENGYQRWREDWLGEGGLRARLARAVDQPMTWLGYEHLDPSSRAEVRFARGLLFAKQSAVLDADREFELARADAGPGELRQGSVFALGLLDLRTAEELYQKIPEVQGAPPQPPAAARGAGAGGAGAAPDEQPDPLALAREGYLASRAHLVERARLDWQHAPTRAGLELCIRRLRHLDEIERQREEEQQRQEQEQEQEPQDQEQEQEQDPEEQDPQEQEQDPEDQQDQEGEEQDPQEQEEVPEETAEAEPPPEATEPEERMLTEEEMKQLLQLLQEHTEAGEELKKRFQNRGRGRVERDW